MVGGEDEAEVEPVYGRTYLPRKFKTVVAVPPSNEVDIFAHDLGFIAILDKKNQVTGWNVTVGGGMGMTHGEPDTFPRTADLMGFWQPEDAIKVAEAVMTVQRDWGNRKNRKNARLKYTIERYGLDAFRAEVEKRVGKTLGAPEALHLHGQRRPLRLGRGRRRPPPPDPLRAGGPDQGYRGRRAIPLGPAPHRRGARRAISASPATRTSSSPTSRRRSAPRSTRWSTSTA